MALLNVENEEEIAYRILRSPTLDTVKKVEDTIKKYNAECTKRKIWERLPKKVMWRTYLSILDYLEEISKIMITKDGIVVYIWNPELAKKYIKKKGIKYLRKNKKSHGKKSNN